MVVKFISFSFIIVYTIFFISILNIRFPPFLGFLREILLLKSFILNPIMVYLFILIVLLSCYYNIYFFWAFCQSIGQTFKILFSGYDIVIFLL